MPCRVTESRTSPVIWVIDDCWPCADNATIIKSPTTIIICLITYFTELQN
jgi:hypothetical protein